MGFVKQKAIFLVFVIALSTLIFPVFIPEAKAQENKECCEKTLSKDFCVYTDASQCDNSFLHSPATCENTDFCQLGCCFDSDSGECFNNVGNAECKSTGSRTFQQGSCSQIPQCAVGCCELSNQAFLSTLTKCKQVTSKYPNVQMKFDPGIQDEYTCVASVRSGVKGCCVQAQGQCSFTTAQECGVQKTLPPPPQQTFPNFQNCITEGNPVDSSLNQQCCQGLTPVTISTATNAKPVCQRTTTTGALDTFPPQITVQSPQGTVTQLSTTLQILTNKAANCKYDNQDKAFDQMSNLFSTTGGTTHSVFVSSLVNGNTYTYYVRCKDPQNNQADQTSTVITFNVNTQQPPTGQVVANFNENTQPQVKTGFFEGYLCSNDELPCDVAKEQHLNCYNEDVYWFDSGNNPENVFLGNSQEQKDLSYNKGHVLENPESMCTASPNDPNCGNCDYTKGTLCGQKDGDFTCIDLNCKDTKKDPNSPDAGGNKVLGESWCLYDGPVGPDEMGAPQDRVGSRHFRASCINGEQIVEPCKDFREELCTQSYSNGQSTTGEDTSLFSELTKNLPQLPGSSSPLNNIFNPTKTNPLVGEGSGYSEAACRQNRFDTCAQCNTLSSGSQVKSCCEDISQRDCSFMQSGITKKGGTCVPLVKPGLRFWSDNNLISSRQSTTNNPTGSAVKEITGKQFFSPSQNPTQTNTPTPQTTPTNTFTTTPQTVQPTGSPATTPQIVGNQNLGLATGNTNAQGTNVNNGNNDVCSQANYDCEVGFTKMGWNAILSRSGWKCTYNCQCLTDDAFTAAHSVCRSIGDCGAYFNYVGVFTEGGFDIKAEGPKGALAIPDRIRDKLMDRARPNFLKYALERPPKTGGGPKQPGIGDFFSKSAIPLSIIGLTALGGLASSATGKGLEAMMGGLLLGPQTMLSFFTPNSAASMGSALQSAGFGSSTFITTIPAGQTIPAGTILTSQQATTLGFVKNGQIVGAGTGNLQAAEGGFQVTGSNLAVPTTGPPLSTGAATGFGYAIGIANAIAWIWTIYEVVDVFFAKTQKGKVGFICKPWVAPDGGNDCDKCNNDPTRPCSEYRCKSLGKLCSIVNAGTDHELCANIQPNDAFSPRIRPDKDYMKDYQIQEDVNNGFTINNKIPAFTPVKLGLITDEPAQCKFSDKPSGNLKSNEAFDAMQFDFGSSLYLIKHNMTFMLTSDLATPQGIQLTNGGQYTIYVRCKDSSGNANGRDYYIKFSIDQGPDLSPPTITSTSISSDTYMKADLTEAPVDIFVDEPATCKWEPNRDIDYDAMQHAFSCVSSALDISSNGGYKCSTTLPLAQAQPQTTSTETTASTEATSTPGNIRNVYYFRCKDKANNKNNQGYPYTLISTNKLQIVNKTPEGELQTANNIILSVQTAGGAESGRAICGYSEQENTELPNMPAFINTLSSTSTQPLPPNLKEGDHRFYVTCIDRAGNEAKDVIQFTIKPRKEGPRLVSVYKESGTLHIVTDEPSTCQYSDKDFNLGPGTDMTNPDTTAHDTTLTNQVYVIKCNDEFNNPPSTFRIIP